MVSKALTLWPNGVVTLPKEWRERYKTKHFLAKETKEGYLVIMPLADVSKVDIEYWEDADGNCGLHFPHGIEVGEFIKLWDQAEANIAAEDRAMQKHTKRNARKRRGKNS
jgi:bifunctional DNA-binding transcriptional regulator/antitoxin component of YhaV-PrlF toxin-antitoxin module